MDSPCRGCLVCGDLSTSLVACRCCVCRGTYVVRVSNPFGTVASAPALVLVGHPPPIVTVSVSPSRFAVGSVMTYSGTASEVDTQAALAPSAFSWTIVQRHDQVNLVWATIPGATGGQFTVPPGGDDSFSVVLCFILRVSTATCVCLRVCVSFARFCMCTYVVRVCSRACGRRGGAWCVVCAVCCVLCAVWDVHVCAS